MRTSASWFVSSHEMASSTADSMVDLSAGSIFEAIYDWHSKGLVLLIVHCYSPALLQPEAMHELRRTEKCSTMTHLVILDCVAHVEGIVFKGILGLDLLDGLLILRLHGQHQPLSHLLVMWL